MAKLTSAKMVEMAKHVESRRTQYWNNYKWNGHPGGNCGLVHPDGVQSFDCNNFVKSLINKPEIAYSTKVWDYAVPGTVIGDVDEYGLLCLCSNITWGNFSNCVPAEVLYMSGHIGLFVGEYTDPSGIINTIEATAAMGGGVLSSYCDASGNRYNHKGGTWLGRWTAHGKLTRFIDYGSQPKPQPTPSGKISVDGEWGKATTLLAQKVFGMSERDGIVSNQDTNCKPYCINCVSSDDNSGSWVWNNSRGYSPLIKKIQAWSGMPYSAQDGKFGYNSIKALQKKLGVGQDGYCGVLTVKAFQQYLNSQVK